MIPQPLQDYGFLIVKRFSVLYAEFAAKPEFDRRIYAVPLFGTSSEEVAVQYHGMDRDPLESFWEEPALAAEMRMQELEEENRCRGFLIYSQKDLLEVVGWANQEHPQRYEPLWARVAGSNAEPPEGFRFLGYEPSYFPGGYFSPIADALCFPRWHGTDPEGVMFMEHFRRLNSRALFDDASDAERFLRYYLSFPWTERGEFSIAEVWAPEGSAAERCHAGKCRNRTNERGFFRRAKKLPHRNVSIA